jgi:hypothetical protein
MDTMQTLTAAFGTRPFTLQQARAAGASREAVRHAVEVGRLRRIGAGIYLVTQEGPLDFLDQVRFAALRHPTAVVVSEGAAALHGMWCPRPTGWRGVVLAAPKSHRTYRAARLVRRMIDEQDVTTVDGIRCTSPARTALDIAAQATLAEGLVVVDSCGRLTNPTRRQAARASYRTGIRDELLSTSARMRGVRGIDRARYAAALANPAAESAPESYARGLFLAAGFPEPAVGRPIRGANGHTYYADLYWPDRRLIVEIDGAIKYKDHLDLIDEKRREDALRGAGYHIRRIMAADMWRTGLPHDLTERRAA